MGDTMHRFSVVVGAVGFLGMVLAGSLGAQDSSAPKLNLPKALVKTKFESEKKYEIGALPTGPVFGKRTVQFEEKGDFTYGVSDGIEAGTFTFDSKSGAIQGKAMSGKTFKGKYDSKTKKLTWDGGAYNPIDPEKPKTKK